MRSVVDATGSTYARRVTSYTVMELATRFSDQAAKLSEADRVGREPALVIDVPAAHHLGAVLIHLGPEWSRDLSAILLLGAAGRLVADEAGLHEDDIIAALVG